MFTTTAARIASTGTMPAGRSYASSLTLLTTTLLLTGSLLPHTAARG